MLTIRLLQEIRPLESVAPLYNAFEHAVHVMSITARYINKDEAIAAGLLHEVKEKLPKHKWAQCKDILIENYPEKDKHKALKFARSVEKLVDGVTQPSSITPYEHASRIIRLGGGSEEVIKLADILSEIQLTTAGAVVSKYDQLINRWILTGQISENDQLIVEIRERIKQRMLYVE